MVSFHGNCTCDRTFHYKYIGNGTWDTTFNYTFHAEMVPMHDDCSVVSGLTSKSHFFFKVVNGLPLSITPDNTFRINSGSNG